MFRQKKKNSICRNKLHIETQNKETKDDIYYFSILEINKQKFRVKLSKNFLLKQKSKFNSVRS